jgi:hypothetical protein
MTPTTSNRLLITLACIAALALSAQAARESGGSDIETMERTTQAVDDTDQAGRQVEADHLFNQRVQLAHGPSYRAAWEGKDESLHCVQRDLPAPRDRLMLADGGVR